MEQFPQTYSKFNGEQDQHIFSQTMETYGNLDFCFRWGWIPQMFGVVECTSCFVPMNRTPRNQWCLLPKLGNQVWWIVWPPIFPDTLKPTYVPPRIVVQMLPLVFLEKQILSCPDPISMLSRFGSKGLAGSLCCWVMLGGPSRKMKSHSCFNWIVYIPSGYLT
jgi:hypothetical protein